MGIKIFKKRIFKSAGMTQLLNRYIGSQNCHNPLVACSAFALHEVVALALANPQPVSVNCVGRQGIGFAYSQIRLAGLCEVIHANGCGFVQ